MKLKMFVQSESLEEFQERINKWIEEMEKKGGKYKGHSFRIGDYGLSVVIEWEEKK